MRKKAAELSSCGETTLEDLAVGWGRPQAQEDVLVESGQRVAADGAAVASEMALSLSMRRRWTYLEMQRRPWLRHYRV